MDGGKGPKLAEVATQIRMTDQQRGERIKYILKEDKPRLQDIFLSGMYALAIF